MDLSSFIVLTTNISVSDIIIITLLIVILRRGMYSYRDILKFMLAELGYIVPILKLLNEGGNPIIIQKLIDEGIITKEELVRYLATYMMLQNTIKGTLEKGARKGGK